MTTKMKTLIAIVVGVLAAYTCLCLYKPEYAEPVATGYSILLGSITNLCMSL